MCGEHMSFQIVNIPQEQIDGITDTFTLPSGEPELLEDTVFHPIRNGQIIHDCHLTVLSPTTFKLDFVPKKDRDSISVAFENINANLVINCGGEITNHILPIKGKIIDQESICGQVIDTDCIEAFVSLANEIDAQVCVLLEAQASAITEEEIFTTVEKC